jgi:hypothetical protein
LANSKNCRIFAPSNNKKNRIVTRKEEREQAARLYSPNNAHHTADTFEYGAEWADKTMLDKVCEWVKKHYIEYAHNRLGQEYIIEDLREAMEE